MKYSVVVALLVSCAITLALGVHAQDAPKEHSMTGCLAKGDAPDTYKLTDVSVPANGPKSVGIVSSDAKLAPHVGHKIEITGTPVAKRCGNGPQRTKGSPLYEGYIDENAFTHLSMIFATA